jgi:hypothetical protein
LSQVLDLTRAYIQHVGGSYTSMDRCMHGL